MLRADNTGVTPSARYAWSSSRTSITFSTYSITCIKFCYSKESLIDVRDDFLHAFLASLSLALFWWVLLLIDSSSITLFLCASLGPGAFFLTHCGSCLVDRGRLDAFTASFTVQSHLSGHLRCAAYFVESWQRLVNTRPGHVVNLLFTTVFR